MAAHTKFTSNIAIEVYFCGPRIPWQRGSNENTNGLLRQHLSRRLNFRTLTRAEVDAIAQELNQRPSTNPRLQDTITSTGRGVAMTA